MRKARILKNTLIPTHTSRVVRHILLALIVASLILTPLLTYAWITGQLTQWHRLPDAPETLVNVYADDKGTIYGKARDGDIYAFNPDLRMSFILVPLKIFLDLFRDHGKSIYGYWFRSSYFLFPNPFPITGFACDYTKIDWPNEAKPAEQVQCVQNNMNIKDTFQSQSVVVLDKNGVIWVWQWSIFDGDVICMIIPAYLACWIVVLTRLARKFMRRRQKSSAPML